jgi:hypothetical protein
MMSFATAAIQTRLLSVQTGFFTPALAEIYKTGRWQSRKNEWFSENLADQGAAVSVGNA